MTSYKIRNKRNTERIKTKKIVELLNRADDQETQSLLRTR